MSDKPLPEKLRRRYQVDTVDEMWRKHLIGGNIRTKQWRHLFGMLPSNPRCVNCHTPFAGFGSVLLRLIRGPLTRRSVKNPRYCAGCHFFTTQFPGGAEIELTMLFVDVRSSTTIAETMNNTEFSQLMNRFYEATINILVQADAFIDKLVGDEVTALFIPGYAGKDHARKAVEAGQELLRVTGYREAGGPWIPIGVGADFTALGDNVNIAARLASNAGAGEILVSESTYNKAALNTNAEKRTLELKGRSEPVTVHVLKIGAG